MDWLIANLADVYRYLTGFLIAWGVFASQTTLKTVMHVHRKYRRIEPADLIYIAILGFTTTFFICSLFVFPEVTSKFMFALLIVEVWYSMFAVYYTYQYIRPCLESRFNCKIDLKSRKAKLQN